MEKWNPVIDQIKDDIEARVTNNITDSEKEISLACQQILERFSTLIEKTIIPLCSEEILDPKLYPALKFLEALMPLALNQNIKLRVPSDGLIKKLLGQLQSLYTQLSEKKDLKDQDILKNNTDTFKVIKGLNV